MKSIRKSWGAAIALVLLFVCSGDIAQAQMGASPQSPTWPARLSRGNVWKAAADLPRKAIAETEVPTVAQADSPEQLNCTSSDADKNDWAQPCPKIVTFDPPGAVQTFAYGINRAGAIVGEYIGSDGTIYGFLREPEGAFTTIDAPGHGTSPGFGTIAWSINPGGEITGTFRDQQGVIHSFVRRDGEFTTFDAPDAGTGSFQGTEAVDINAEGEIAGEYIDGANVRHGYVRTCDGTIAEFDAPGAGTHSTPQNPQGTFVANTDGLNAKGEIAGYYVDDANVIHGFVRDRDGEIKEFDIAGAGSGAGQGVESLGINDKGETLGAYADDNNVFHAFVRAPDGKITSFNVPGSGTEPFEGTFAGLVSSYVFGGINPSGEIAGDYVDASGVAHGFLRYRDGHIVTFDVPHAADTFPNSNNATDVITGWFLDANGMPHGFVRTQSRIR